jgi:hypothetical protein
MLWNDHIRPRLETHALAYSCIIAPLLLSLLVFTGTQAILIPSTLFPENWDHTGNLDRLQFNYSAAQPSDALDDSERAAAAKKESAAAANKEAATAPGSAPKTAAPAGGGAAPPQKNMPDLQKVVPDAAMFLPALNYSGRISFAIASGFLFIASLTTLIFAIVVLASRRSCKYIVYAFAAWVAVAALITFGFSNPHGRYLVVQDLLNAADGFAHLDKFAITLFGYRVKTGTLADYYVHANTLISLIPVGMLLTALMELSVRDDASRKEPSLKARLMTLRCALVLGSTCFVFGVLSNKALVEWPLQLVNASQAKALRPIADSLVLQFGALGTAAIFGAFAPAIVAWMLDVNNKVADPPVKRKIGKAAKVALPAKDDGLIFAPMTTITAIVALLAPVLASPVFDTLKSLVSALGK